MIFRELFKRFWLIFDVFCYILAFSFINFGIFQLNSVAGFISLGITFAITGFASELINYRKGGGK
ncbi:DUF1056 family protein [Liquorilactobacillus vini]|uniref:DUF1056 family protein n=1 Tax=Liquorilactobacillus vini TaxID=238015 RepID=UPI0002E71D2D|nr:DUF1056 family protein [Liquorilactobacillus vini]